MTARVRAEPTLTSLDDATRALVRLAAIVTVGGEDAIRAGLGELSPHIPPTWIEELILQTYLFAGFPRALNAMREWRRISGSTPGDSDPRDDAVIAADGERTCARVYGAFYDRLRVNIRHLHPALDEWMVVEGYGKVLARPGLDLGRRELCIVAACAVAEQDRQLHSHLHGALNAGVAPSVVTATIDMLSGLLKHERAQSVRMLWARVQGK